MDVVTIFLTHELAGRPETFIHDNTRFEFEHLASQGPRRLIEGPVWAFVDWIMPDLAGLEMCRRLRANPSTRGAHIIIVLERENDDERRRALHAGADDYMVGPIDRTMVLDRVLALHAGADRRGATEMIQRGPLTINLAALQARWNGTPLRIRPNEFGLLRYFVENSDRVLTRPDLIAGLGKQEMPIVDRTVDVWVGRLRRALKAVGAGTPLRTVRSVGYVFDTPAD